MGSIIIIAPPAAGKGTQSKFISERYHIPHISTGDLLRNEINKKTNIGLEVSNIINKGALVSDHIILDILSQNIQNIDDYILDGFPRNIEQAKEYDKMINSMGKKIDKVFYIHLPKEQSKLRILSRLSCSNCGKVYNTAFDETKPKRINICDACGNNLEKRDDDLEEVFENRYQIYEEETKPLLDFYHNKNLLYTVDGSADKMSIFHIICSILEGEK